MEVKLDNMHRSPLANPSCHVIVKGSHFVQATSALGQAMLTTPQELLFFNILASHHQNDLLHHLSRDADDKDWLMASRLLFFSLSDDGVTLAFLHSSPTSPILHASPRMMEAAEQQQLPVPSAPSLASHRGPCVYRA